MPQLKPNYNEFRQEIRRRNITSLVHFTSTLNLLGMFKLGKILDRVELENMGHDHLNNDHLLDYIQMTDEYRYDDPSYINLSIEHPNSFLLKKFKEKTKANWEIQWCILKIDTEPIYWDSTRFSVTNAASNAAKRNGIGKTFDHFLSLFQDNLAVKNRRFTRNNLAQCYPTDVQAEVLVKESIDLKYIQEIVFENEDDKSMALSALRIDGAGNKIKNLDFNIDEQLFSKTRN